MRLESVGKRYGVRQPWVVRELSADLPPGRLVRVEGPNGSGKSTLLRVVSGVCLPSRGRVTGRPQAGYVPERFPGGLPFAARDYLLHMARVHGLRGPDASARVDEWLERLGASGFAGAPLRSLSKGMCQKIAIAQALLCRPGLLVLDEAWTGLDQVARGTVDAAALERVRDGGRVLFVDHDPARLAGQASERWQLDGSGRVTAAAGDHHAPLDAGHHASHDVVAIELAGLDHDSLPRLSDLPGVLASREAGAGVTVQVSAGRSDEVLREVLSWDGVHVRAVRADGTR